MVQPLSDTGIEAQTRDYEALYHEALRQLEHKTREGERLEAEFELAEREKIKLKAEAAVLEADCNRLAQEACKLEKENKALLKMG